MIFSTDQLKWASKNLDVIFLIPLLIFIIVSMLGLFDLNQKYSYIPAMINFVSTLGIFYLINNAVARKEFRKTRIVSAIIISVMLVYASINYPAFKCLI